MNLRIEEPDTVINSVKGRHKFGKSNENVSVLYIISFNSNCIKHIPTGVGKMFKNLVKIQVVEEPLATISSNDFIDIKSLQIIEIRKTFLSLIPEDTFSNLLTLEILNLSDNRIQELKPKTFGNLLNLRRVLLSGNLLISLPSQLFAGNVNLEEIDLSANRLRFIDTTFDSLKNSTRILMADNFCIIENSPLELLIRKISENCKAGSIIVSEKNLTESTSELFKLREMNDDLRFATDKAYKDIEFLKNIYDRVMENFTKIDEVYHEKLKREEILRKQSESELEAVQMSREIITTTLISSSLILVVVLIISTVIFMIALKRLKMKLKKFEEVTEMTNYNVLLKK